MKAPPRTYGYPYYGLLHARNPHPNPNPEPNLSRPSRTTSARSPPHCGTSRAAASPARTPRTASPSLAVSAPWPTRRARCSLLTIATLTVALPAIATPIIATLKETRVVVSP
eukprot:scaffold17003_cov36-Phaeocystis_antarctica.AAC.2